MMPRASTAPKLLRPGGLREFARLAAEAAAVGVFASLVLLIAALFIATAEAASPESPATGTLLLKGADTTIPAPLLATDVRIEFAGIVARTTRHATLHQPGRRLARRRLRLPAARNGGRRSSRDAHRRAPHGGTDPRARAGAAGRTSRQSRKARRRRSSSRNVRTCSRRASHRSARTRKSSCRSSTSRRCATTAGAFSVRFPMAITPRYIPGTPIERHRPAPAGRPTPISVPDASRVTPPVVHPFARQGPSGHARRSSSTQDSRSRNSRADITR